MVTSKKNTSQVRGHPKTLKVRTEIVCKITHTYITYIWYNLPEDCTHTKHVPPVKKVEAAIRRPVGGSIDAPESRGPASAGGEGQAVNTAVVSWDK